MNKKLLILMLFVTLNVLGQRSRDQYSFEAAYGLGASGQPGITQFSHFDVGFRYMLNEKWGFKFDYGSDRFREDTEVAGINTETGVDYHRLSFNVVHNLGRTINIHNYTAGFNVLAHAGFGYSWINPVNISAVDEIDSMGNVIIGITPQCYIMKNLALHADVSYIVNFSQHRDFDGQLHYPTNGVKSFVGSMANVSLGLTYYFGANKSDSDWR